ncbi:MAG: zinc ribbon domain-containing protein [Candidatus Riflebacteria bacterium]|nr:zinc ribbon domain-containing protein [Candidatus Riflebacteria bacterium]
MNKKILLVLFIFITLTSVSYAKSCIACGMQIPDTANFCGICGVAQPKLDLPGVSRTQTSSFTEQILKEFAFLDDFERHIHNHNNFGILGEMPNIRTQFNNVAAFLRTKESVLTPEAKLLIKAYAAKYQIYESMNHLGKDLRSDVVFKNAMKLYNVLALSYYNEIIEYYRQNSFHQSPDFLQKVQSLFKSIETRLKQHKITSKFIKFQDIKIPQGSNFVVTGISKDGKTAELLYLGGHPAEVTAIIGSSNLKSLYRRSTFTPEDAFYFLEAARN